MKLLHAPFKKSFDNTCRKVRLSHITTKRNKAYIIQVPFSYLSFIFTAQCQWNKEGRFLNDDNQNIISDSFITNPPFNNIDRNFEQLHANSCWQHGTTLIQKIINKTQQIRTLTGALDALLPKVMSEEVRVDV